ncbi:hypothetical protein [Chryseobacterium defluvii]|uniref:Lysozyme n=1 Tax=Chryseobacterium defluvii TaxID=160396 RepID=A0A495SEE9_9FLAO|nr:hypothetical protein [Chryseobacterium defluvii]RKS98236.1 hypothetical protein BCF58_2377 [Chryseobacterium defluvii]
MLITLLTGLGTLFGLSKLSLKSSFSSSFVTAESFKVSDSLVEFMKYIEGFKATAYKYKSDPVTVGSGLTIFSNGTKPILGKTYSVEFLNNEKKIMLQKKTQLAIKNIFPHLLRPVTQQEADVFVDLYYQGLVESRRKGLISAFNASKQAFCNWLLSEQGIGPNFFIGGDTKFLLGTIKRRYWQANYAYGTVKTFKECDAFISPYSKLSGSGVVQYYRSGKLKIPSFL